MPRPAVFLDRDGVLVHDRGLVTASNQLELCDRAPEAVSKLRALGLCTVVVTNQPVVARGLVTEAQVDAIHETLRAMLGREQATIDRFYFCPHHPKADLPRYRRNCSCRKPRAGMLRRAMSELDLAADESFMIGDRPSDILAGVRAGCRTVLVKSGNHDAPAIETPDPPEIATPNWVVDRLIDAVDLIGGAMR